MANSFERDRWTLDSTGSVIAEPIYVKRVRIYNTVAVTAGDVLVELQKSGSAVQHLKYIAVGAWNDISDLIEEWWHQGFEVAVIAGNVVCTVEIK